MANIDYLKEAYRGAQNGNEVAMLQGLNEYYEHGERTKSVALEKRLYDVLVKNLEHNIRMRIFLGLGTDENPRYNLADLVQAKADIDKVITIKSFLVPGSNFTPEEIKQLREMKRPSGPIEI